MDFKVGPLVFGVMPRHKNSRRASARRLVYSFGLKELSRLVHVVVFASAALLVFLLRLLGDQGVARQEQR
jgi:hypothetical protein